jgi:3-oxoadipate enol-lactonase
MLLTLPSHCRIHYDLLGPPSGETVCFLHSLASDGGMWAEQVPGLLAANYRVLRIDLCGHGGSEAGKGDATIDELADDALAVLDHLGIARLHLVGLSIGGIVAQAMAVRWGQTPRNGVSSKPGTVEARGLTPDLLSLMLCDTACATPPAWREVWPERMRTVRNAGSVAPLADSTIARWFTDAFRARDPRRWREIRDTIAGMSPAGYLHAAAALLDFDFTRELASLRVPTLVVCGELDEGTPPAVNRRIAELVPGARYEEIAGGRHMPNVEFAEAFNRMMLAWLAGKS